MRSLNKLSVLLWIVFMMPFATFAQGDATAITIGDTQEGDLTAASGVALYTFALDETTTVKITLLSPDFDAYLALLNEGGDELAADDDSAGDLDSQLTVTLPAGSYTIAAQSYAYYFREEAVSGEFSVRLEALPVERIEYDQTVEGELTADRLAIHYVFDGQAGDSILIALNSDDFDTYLALEFDNDQLFYNDDGGDGLNAQIGPYILPFTGEYTIIATSYANSQGEYTLSLMPVDVTHIEQGEAVELSFTESTQIIYLSFSAEANSILDITTESDFEVDIFFRGNMDGFTNRRDTDHIDGLIIPVTGSFVLELSPVPYTIPTLGDFTLQVTPTEIPSLNEGSQVFSFGASINYRVFFSLDVEAGETYRVTLNVLDDANSALTLYASQDGEMIEQRFSSEEAGMFADFTPETSGTVRFMLYDYAVAPHDVEVSIEPLSAE